MKYIVFVLLFCFSASIANAQNSLFEKYKDLTLSKQEERVLRQLEDRKKRTNRRKKVIDSLDARLENFGVSMHIEFIKKAKQEISLMREDIGSVKASVQKTIEQNPSSPSIVFLEMINNIEKSLDTLQMTYLPLTFDEIKNKKSNANKELESFVDNFSDIQKYLNILRSEKERIGNGKIDYDSTLFAPGKYKLKDEAKKMLYDYVIERFTFMENEYGNQQLTILISATGYADEQPFKINDGRNFILNHNLKGSLPNRSTSINLSTLTSIQNRKFLNEVLSRKRAQEISNYIESILSDKNCEILEVRSLGEGEKYPFTNETYEFDDIRRRICQYYIVYVPSFLKE
ncbi:hypothetical protein WAF17_16470 [Bernardetia sp. ABR2-2B]|uniref:hypothetical protein n=1 Tax=Bernardetia sp. ABR2-2B TaxID=3127472 RepID=UPI0030D25C6A